MTAIDEARRAVIRAPDVFANWIALAQAFEKHDLGIAADAGIRALMLDPRPESAALPLVGLGQYFLSDHYLVLFHCLAAWRRTHDYGMGELVPNLERALLRRPPLTEGRKRSAMTLLGFDPTLNARPAVFVAGMPKSASTFLCRAVGESLDIPVRSAHSFDDFIGTHTDLRVMADVLLPRAVVHSHMPASVRFMALDAIFDLRPVVLIRDIFDALRSYLDHAKGGHSIGHAMAEVAFEDQRAGAIAMIAWFYVHFFASWNRRSSEVSVLMLNYEQITGDPGAAVQWVIAHAGLPQPDRDRVDAVLDRLDGDPEEARLTRRNAGVSGRGRDFTDEERQRVRQLYRLYPDVDFRPIDPGYVPPA